MPHEKPTPLQPIVAEEFDQLIGPFGPFESDPRVAVGVSGGADSLCLVLLLNFWLRRHQGRVVDRAAEVPRLPAQVPPVEVSGDILRIDREQTVEISDRTLQVTHRPSCIAPVVVGIGRVYLYSLVVVLESPLVLAQAAKGKLQRE